MSNNQYTVYIKYPSEVSNNKCKPKTQNITSNTSPSKSTNAMSQIQSTINNVKNPLGALTGAAKAIPGAVAAIAVAKMAEKIVDAAIPYVAGYTGDYTFSKNWSNAKSVISCLTNPIGAINQYATAQMNAYRENLKVSQSALLTGNSIINTCGGKTSN